MHTFICMCILHMYEHLIYCQGEHCSIAVPLDWTEVFHSMVLY